MDESTTAAPRSSERRPARQLPPSSQANGVSTDPAPTDAVLPESGSLDPAPELGRGRSGLVLKVPRDVWLTQAAADAPNKRAAPHFDLARGDTATMNTAESTGGRPLAVKIFRGEALARLVHLVFSGAPNPYTWNADAVRCALLRRELLVDLVDYWFDGRVAIAAPVGSRWNATHRAFELAADFVDGRPATLHHPFSADREDEFPQLVADVMRPLQRHLEAAGLDGLVWQAGRGNPVATNNFLLSADTCEPTDVDSGQQFSSRRQLLQCRKKPCWTWIDMESGVPALFPINPWLLLSFYLPRSWRHGRPLFDDVDVARFRQYLDEHALAIGAKLGLERLAALRRRADELDRRQQNWKRLSRLERSVAYALSQDRISQPQAEWYRRRPVRWYSREAWRAAKTAAGRIAQWPSRIARRIAELDIVGRLADTCRALSSQTFRARLARGYVGRRVDAWHERSQLSAAEAEQLRTQLRSGAESAYLTDFGMHLAIKVPMKLLLYGVVLPLAAAGLIGPLTAAVLLLAGGPLGRTVYTLTRLGEAVVHRAQRPWVALLVGLLPVVGNVAYPVQVLHASASRQNKLAQFIVCDATTRVGELLPIWGGRDTGTEHFFNRLSDLVVRDRRAAITGGARLETDDTGAAAEAA